MSRRSGLGSGIRGAFLIVSAWMMLALTPSAQASTAYGTLNNFDCVNDTGVEAHGFEIELVDVQSKDITYTYDYNHYGIPKITEDHSDPLHPNRVFIRYAATRNPDGTWTAFTAIPSGPITPTDGHQFTNPSVNFGGEHFGAGYYGAPSAVKYNWLIDDGTGNLIHGPPVHVATPTFTYYPPAPAQPPQVQAVIVPPPPPDPPVLQFGEATWVKAIKTTTHNPNKVELMDLVDPDPENPAAHNWANGEPAEVETEWRILQTEFANAGNPKGELRGLPEDLPGGDEVITRRYEFYKYLGPIDAESGEAMADQVGPDGIHGVGSATYNDHIDPESGEWVTVTVDLSIVEVVGDFFGAQMSGFDIAPVLGLIDHIPDGELNVPYAERTVVVPGTDTPFHATTSGSLPDGTTLDEFTGVFSGTPTAPGVFTFTVDARDLFSDAVLASKTYTVTIPGGVPVTNTITTHASPVAGGSTTGDGIFDNGTPVTVVAAHSPDYAFVNWTEGGIEVSVFAVYPFTVTADRTLRANFVPIKWIIGAIPTDELVLNYGVTYGLWHYGQTTGWAQLNTARPAQMLTADIDSDGVEELVAGFTGYGLYTYDPTNLWTPINTVIPENMIRLNNGIACDFGATHGLWYWTQTGGWEQWNSADPDKLLAVDVDNDGADELVASFAGYGLYWRDETGLWTPINTTIPENMIPLSNGIACDYGATYGLWYWSQAGGWQQWSTVNPDKLLAVDVDNDGADDLVASFAGYGLCWRNGTGPWTPINTVIPENMIRLNNGIACDYGAAYGLWVWSQGGGWVQRNTVDPGQMVAVDIDKDGVEELVVSFPGYGLYYRDETSGWHLINDVVPDDMKPINFYP